MLWEVCLHAAVALAGIPYVETDAAAASSTRYKYIVVGGGAAGCAAAATLAERHPTLLVERGPVRTVAPTTDSFDTFHARFGLDDWAQIGDMITTTEGTRAISPRVLGGATAFNAGIYNRDEVNGSFERAGFDPSRIASAYEWVESIVEPQLAKAEADGSLVAALRAEAGSRLGLPFDGSAPIEMPSRPGLFRTYTTLPQGGRGRTAADDLLKRPGLRLTVLVQSPVALVLLDEQSRAVGIEFRDERDGRRYRAFVEDEGGEVVVSSGVFGTPPLLMRSGIGPAGHLAEHGIPVRVDSPTVGEITEPPTHMVGVFGNSDQPQPGVINSFAGRLNAHIVMESFSHEVQTRGLIAAQCSLIPAPRRTEADCKRLASIMAERSVLNRDFVSFVGFGIKLLDPASRGTVRLRSRSADDLPLVTLNQYLEQADLQKMVAAVKQVAEVVSSPSISAARASRTPTMLTFLQGTLQGTDGTLEPPPFINVPPEGANETAIASLLKDSVATFYHTCGGTVGAVSRDFTVNGAIGLRVADLSILHHAPGTNPMASAMVIGRYAAQVIADRPMRTSSAIDTAAFSSRDNGPSVTIGAGAIVGVALGAAAAVVVAAALCILALRNCRNAPEAGLAIAASLDRLARANSEIDEMSRSIAEGWPNPDSAEAALAEGRQILPRKRLLLRCVAAFMPVSIRPCSVLLKDVSAFCCDIKNRSKVNAVLSNVCCSFGAGRLSAIVGPSGSGKSTLMDYLARARSHAHFSGSIRFGGVGFEEWRKENRVGFVPQQSTFVPVLSAYEHLLFQAALRMPGADHATRVLKVNKVMLLVGLRAKKHIKCGGPLPGGFTVKGLSGGEQRLLSIATVLLEENPVLILDEPASGLDSHHALAMMVCLRVLSDMGHTVILSVHQPSKELWEMVDSVLCLSLGRVVFSGPTAAMLPWFEEQGFVSQPTENPVSFVMDLVTVGVLKSDLLYGNHTIRTADGIRKLAADFRRTHIAKLLWQRLADVVATGLWREWCVEGADSRRPLALGATLPRRRSRPRAMQASWSMQVRTLCHRRCMLTARNPGDALARLVCYFGIGIMTGVVFSGVDDAQSWLSLLFWISNSVYLLPFAVLTLYTASKVSH